MSGAATKIARWRSNRPTASEERFAEYLTIHGYQADRDLDWRAKFDVQTEKNPDFLVSRAGEELAICEVKEFTDTPVNRRLAQSQPSTGPGAELYSPVSDAIRDGAREQMRPFARVDLALVIVLANPRWLHRRPRTREHAARALRYR